MYEDLSIGRKIFGGISDVISAIIGIVITLSMWETDDIALSLIACIISAVYTAIVILDLVGICSNKYRSKIISYEQSHGAILIFERVVLWFTLLVLAGTLFFTGVDNGYAVNIMFVIMIANGIVILIGKYKKPNIVMYNTFGNSYPNYPPQGMNGMPSYPPQYPNGAHNCFPQNVGAVPSYPQQGVPEYPVQSMGGVPNYPQQNQNTAANYFSPDFGNAPSCPKQGTNGVQESLPQDNGKKVSLKKTNTFDTFSDSYNDSFRR